MIEIEMEKNVIGNRIENVIVIEWLYCGCGVVGEVDCDFFLFFLYFCVCFVVYGVVRFFFSYMGWVE